MTLHPFARRDQARNAQYPTLYLSYCALGRRQVGLEERSEATVLVGAGEPGGDAVGVMLITRPVLTSKAATPKCRIDLGYSGTPSRNVPAVERPEMHTLTELLADEAQPRNSGMRGFRGPILARQNKTPTWRRLRVLRLSAASGCCPFERHRFRRHHRARSPRRCCHRQSASVSESHQGMSASRALGHILRNSAVETKNHGRCQLTSACLAKADAPAIRRCRVASNTYAHLVAPTPRRAAIVDLQYTRAAPLGSLSEFRHPNSRCRYVQ